MKKRLNQLRDKIIYEVWQKYKSQLSMEDLAGFFNLSLKSIYRIIKKRFLATKEGSTTDLEGGN